MKNLKVLSICLFTLFLCVSCKLDFITPSDEGSLKVTLPGKEIASRAIETPDIQTFRFNVSVLQDGKIIQSKTALTSETIYFEDLDVGDYLLQVDAYDVYDTDFTWLLYRGTQEATVKENKTSEVEVILKGVYTFSKNQYDTDKYNYYMGLPFNSESKFFASSCNELNTLRKDAKIEVKTTFVPDTDFNGNVIFYYYHNDDQGNWASDYTINSTVNWKKGEPCTVVNKFVVVNDANPDYEYGIAYIYEPKDKDEATHIIINSSEINTNATFETVTYTYHYLNNKIEIKAGKNQDYHLLEEWEIWSHVKKAYMYCQKIKGWYEKDDSNKKIITDISADENTINREFVLDYDLYFSKNTWDTDYNYRFELPIQYLFNDLTQLPNPGEHIKFVFSGTIQDFTDDLKNQLSRMRFSSELADNSNGWERLYWGSNTCEPNDTGFKVFFDLVMPEGAYDINHIVININYSHDVIDKEITLSDWSIEKGNVLIERTAETEHMSLESDVNGVRIKLSNLGRYFGLWVTDTETGTRFACEQSYIDANGGTIEFIYPFCNENQEMHFSLTGNKAINELSDESTWIDEEVYVLAGGGLGPINYTNYNKIELGYHEDGSGRFFTSNNIKDCVQSFMQDNMTWNGGISSQDVFDKTFYNYSVICGKKDWSDNTEWGFGIGEEAAGNMEQLNDYGESYLSDQLFNHQRFNILDNEILNRVGISSPYDFNEKCASHNTVWLGFSISMTTKDLPYLTLSHQVEIKNESGVSSTMEIMDKCYCGRFETKEIQTGAYKYSKANINYGENGQNIGGNDNVIGGNDQPIIISN